MKVTYIDHMGNDLSVVNAARVSFNKKSEWDYAYGDNIDEYYFNEKGWCKWDGTNLILIDVSEVKRHLHEKDKKLISYLATHNHWSPFTHTSICLHWKVPLFLKNQLYKHMIGLNFGEPIGEEMPWNEVSRRYVDEEPEFWYPEYFRPKGGTSKQGSLDEEHPGNEYYQEYLNRVIDFCTQAYEDALANKVAPEQARMFLPENTYTEWYWTGSLMAWARIYNQRTHEGAQKDLLPLMDELDKIMSDLYPVSWEALLTKGNN